MLITLWAGRVFPSSLPPPRVWLPSAATAGPAFGRAEPATLRKRPSQRAVSLSHASCRNYVTDIPQDPVRCAGRRGPEKHRVGTTEEGEAASESSGQGSSPRNRVFAGFCLRSPRLPCTRTRVVSSLCLAVSHGLGPCCPSTDSCRSQVSLGWRLKSLFAVLR